MMNFMNNNKEQINWKNKKLEQELKSAFPSHSWPVSINLPLEKAQVLSTCMENEDPDLPVQPCTENVLKFCMPKFVTK